MMKKYFIFVILIGLFFSLSLAKVEAATPTVTSFSIDKISVGRYQKFEATFQISKSYTSTDPTSPNYQLLAYYYYDPSDTTAYTWRSSPYGRDGITIDVYLTSPSGKSITLPAFYYQDYVRGGSIGSAETMTPTTNYSWKFRFAPQEVGNYSYYLTITDKEGSSRYPASGTLTFASVASTSKGFVRVSPRDSRFWEFDNGMSFVPISSGHQYYLGTGSRSWDYEDTFNKFGANKVNFLRIWSQCDDWALTIEGPYDGYPDYYKPSDAEAAACTKGTQINQRGGYEFDRMIDSAEKNNVYMQVCSHGDPYWIWDASVYNEAWNHNLVSFNNQYNLNYWKRNLRYRIARWGYSTSIFAWEFWNEQDQSTSVGSNLYNYYQNLGDYLKQNDPYQHLRTTSHGSQTWSPAMWESPAFDIANYHDYMMISPERYSADFAGDEVKFVYTFAQCLRTPKYSNYSACPGMAYGSESWSGNKPIVWGEMDTGTSNWDTPNPNIRADHNAIWAGLFSPIGMVPVEWYFESKRSYLTTKLGYDQIAGSYFSTIDYAGEHFSYLSTSDISVTSSVINATNSKMRVLAMRNSSANKAFAWVHHKDYIWGNGNSDTVGSPISGSFTIPAMTAGNYKIEFWNTHSGGVTDGGTVSASGGNVTVNVNNLNNDVAVKIISTTAPPATPTPSSSACLAGDANNDRVVNISDFTFLLARFHQSPSTSCADQHLDGSLNAVDLGVVLLHLP